MIRTPGELGRKFLKDRNGVAALEFALVAPMLFALIFASIEAGWLMVQTIMLDRALDKTVRSLRIGNIPNPTLDNVRAVLCSEAMVLADCQRTVTLEFVPILSPSDYPTDLARCANRLTGISPILRFNAGSRSQTVFVRACFVVEPFTPGLGLGLALSKDETGSIRIVAKSGFVNEPS
ncbi:MAG: pilus assembly protein [Candidatus Devosia phytovorans]|uniref:Pilus assembly protein n=1 Tax=Candidatus Devosia phytovorans TaxID=3121372 RepID=A0AAJ5VRE7_9HYPH|nr:TadE/TadG family type IV pilus assembly protein [Devosia sp.]WEK03239.1 MAG: pilus assembly protein [Devosia sp.]